MPGKIIRLAKPEAIRKVCVVDREYQKWEILPFLNKIKSSQVYPQGEIRPACASGLSGQVNLHRMTDASVTNITPFIQ